MLRALAISCLLASPLAAQEFFTLKGHGGPIMDIAVSDNGTIATASFDNAVGLWDGSTPTWLDGHEAAVIAVNFWSDTFAVSGGDDFSVRLWIDGQKTSRILGHHAAKVTDLAMWRDKELVVSASWDGTLGLWPLSRDWNKVLYPPLGQNGTQLRGHKLGVNAVAFGPDGALYSASSDGTIRRWNIDTGNSRAIVKNGFAVNKLVVDPEGAWLAYGAVDGVTRIIDLKTETQLRDLSLQRRPILAMDFDPVGKQLAVGDGEGYIMVVDTQTWRITRDFRATQGGPVWALAFSPDGQNLHAGGIEDIMYSWPVATMDEHEGMTGTTRSFLENPDTLPNGERQFKRKCSICHTLTQGSARKAGPSLYGLFGRKAGTVGDYTYSQTLNGSEIIWSAETINALFDIGPDHYIPGSKMPMQRIVKQGDRDDLIDFLRKATTAGEN